MFPNYLDGATVLMIAYLAEDSENEFVKKIIDGTIESKTARELYKISENFMKTIEIITVE